MEYKKLLEEQKPIEKVIEEEEQNEKKLILQFIEGVRNNELCKLMELIENGLRINSDDYYNLEITISYALDNKNMDTLKFILNNLMVDKYIDWLIKRKKLDRIKKFIKCDSIFMLNYFANSYPLHNCLACDSTEICQYLIEFGLGNIDINKKNVYGETPLHVACSRSNVKIVKLLCLQGKKIQINAIDERQRNAFHYACKRRHQILEIIEILLKTSINKNLLDKYGNSAFAIACKNNAHEIVRYLLSVQHKFFIKIDYQNQYVVKFKLKYPSVFKN